MWKIDSYCREDFITRLAYSLLDEIMEEKKKDILIDYRTTE